jgi:hypothetical protein
MLARKVEIFARGAKKRAPFPESLHP